LARQYWNNGYVTEATKALISHLFNNSDLIRIEAQTMVENAASGKVLEKSGMKFEGILRKRAFIKGRDLDMKMYSILRNEWNGYAK
jgi:ribosomal-protein-alanine N-acetyltransferase